MIKLRGFTFKQQNKSIDKALREHYKESCNSKRVPLDYLLMFTEGGESNAVADEIAQSQLDLIKDDLRKQGIEVEVE